MFQQCKARYTPISLHELIRNSDLIVEYRIKKVYEYQILVEKIKIIKGEINSDIILVNKFTNWTCASRWSEYKIGQQGLFFLSRDSSSKKWEILGQGNEGDMPIENGYLYYYTIFEIKGFKLELYEVMGESTSALRFEYEECITAINEFFKKSKQFETLIKTNKVSTYKTNNNFLRRILEEMKEDLRVK